MTRKGKANIQSKVRDISVTVKSSWCRQNFWSNVLLLNCFRNYFRVNGNGFFPANKDVKTWPYLFRFCDRHNDCGEDALLGSSASVAKIKLASNSIWSILKAIGLKRQNQSKHHNHFLLDIGKIWKNYI